MIDDCYYEREQSAAKHQILERYLKAFTPIIGSWANEIVYVDCFAGPWNSKADDLSDTSFSRAISVLRSVKAQGRCKRVRSLLIENDAEKYLKLKRWADGIEDVEVTAVPWDFETSVHKIVDFIRGTDTPCSQVFSFIFIDPWGWELVTIDRISPLLRLDPGEVLITFMSSFVDRFLGDPTKPFERLLGSAHVRRLRQLQGEELEDELVATYAHQIRTAGNFDFSCAVPVMDPKRDRFLFHIVFATRNMRGVEEFKEAERNMIEVMHRLRASGQRRRALEQGSSGFLFDPIATYKEERFSRFRTSALLTASKELEEKVRSDSPIFVQELLKMGLQYSAVLKEDVIDLIGEWIAEGKVSVRGVSPRQRALRPENIIEWVRF